jgi:predicted NBD/HSP70 family sugar kinase
MVFLTISTGVGGGIVLNGRPLLGLAGHFGLLGSASAAGPLEDSISGHWIASQAKTQGHDLTAIGVFAAATAGEGWANEIVDASAQKVALLSADIQLLLDPRRIVIGGGIGLAAGFLDRVRANLKALGPRLRPILVAAKLGTNAGLVGVADLARSHSRHT